MFRYKFSRDYRAVYVEHSGEFLRDEGDRALLEAFSQCSSCQLARLEKFIADYRYVTAVSLEDSDGARLRLFWKEVERVLEEKQASHIAETAVRYVILPEDSSAREAFKERLRRISGNYTEAAPLGRMSIVRAAQLREMLSSEGISWDDNWSGVERKSSGDDRQSEA